jgi:hypothetical protein
MNITNEMIQAACNVYDYYNKEHNNVLLRGVSTGHGMKAALEAAIQTMWVNIDDGLPTTFDNVLVLDSKEGYHVAFYNTQYDQWFSVCNRQLYNVTHWMPLPKCKREG